MKFGFRIPSITKRIAARTSVKRIIRHNLGFKAPRGMGWLTDPKRFLYNKIYNKTSRGCMANLMMLFFGMLILIVTTFSSCSNSSSDNSGAVYVKPSVDYKGKYRKGHIRMPRSSKPDAMKSRNRSRYHYQTRGKYRKRKG
jgi:hypothetical protein